MSEENIINMLLDNLHTIQHKQDKQQQQLTDIEARLSVIEAKIEAQQDINKKVDALDTAKDQAFTLRNILLFLIPTAIAILSLYK